MLVTKQNIYELIFYYHSSTFVLSATTRKAPRELFSSRASFARKRRISRSCEQSSSRASFARKRRISRACEQSSQEKRAHRTKCVLCAEGATHALKVHEKRCPSLSRLLSLLSSTRDKALLPTAYGAREEKRSLARAFSLAREPKAHLVGVYRHTRHTSL